MAILTTEELDLMVSANSTFSSFIDFVSTIGNAASMKSYIDSIVIDIIDDIVQANTDSDTFAAYLGNNVGINREAIRAILAQAIFQQRRDRLDQTSMSTLMTREIFKDIIRNRSSDVYEFRTLTQDDLVPSDPPEDLGKYIVEDD